MNSDKSRSIICLILSLITLVGCATTSQVAQSVTLGMSPQQVLVSSGKPYSKNIYRDSEGNYIEEWSYKETTWDDAGWSWDKTVINTVITFENGQVKSMNNAGERFKNPMAPALNIYK